jgi:iron complex outermembrane recepter protein
MRSVGRIYTTASVVAVIATLSVSSAARAADADATVAPPEGLAEIVVTAQKRSENLQNVPITVTALSADQLGAANVRNPDDLANLVPGFQGNGSAGVGSPHIRGVGTSITAAGNDTAIATYIDGAFVPANVNVPIYNFKDATEVEVLKGPQGTLFGRNATGGLINITTRDPGQNFEAEGEVGYANYQTESGYVYVGGPLSDSVATGLALSVDHQGQGWGRNVYDGSEIGRVPTDLSVRSKWLAKLSSDTDMMVSLHFVEQNQACLSCFHPYPPNGRTSFGTFPVPDPWDDDSSKLTGGKWGQADATVRLTHDFGFARLTSVSSYFNITSDLFNFNVDPVPSAPVSVISLVHTTQITEELQLTSESAGPLQWQGGLYYLKAHPIVKGAVSVQGVGDLALGSGTDVSSYAAYAQATYAFTDKDKFTLGARVTREEDELVPNPLIVDGTGGQHSLVSNTPTWRAALDHQFTNDLGAYVSATRGFKPGGFNNVASGVQQGAFKAESILAYEIGAKTLFFDHRLRLNVSGFYSDYSNLQVQTLNALGLEDVSNAAKAKFYGVDLDCDVALTRNFTIYGALENLHSEYTSFPAADIFSVLPSGGTVESVGSVAGNQAVLAPTLTGSLAPTYRIGSSHGNFDSTLTYSYNSGYFATVDNRLRQPSYGLLGASVKYSTINDKYWVKLWGSNLTNVARTSLLSFASFGAEAIYDAPRTYGITFGMKL